tara:strand:- start:83 stop:289 length:207 start_codon:yes stop_codon:yes gene_type:complete
MSHNKGVLKEKIMQSAQLLPNLRYISLSDDEGTFGLFIHHEGPTVLETYQVMDKEQFTSVYEMFSNLA